MADQITIPPSLQRGDCIGLFSPAGPIKDQEKVKKGISILHDLGFKTQISGVEKNAHQYLSGNDIERANEFHHLWSDPDIKAMMAVRGGYGCLRLMPYLDMNLLQQASKLLIGFSDLTILLNTFADKLHTVTVHGPVLTTLPSLDKESLDSFLSFVSGSFARKLIFRNLEVLRGGVARGTLRGGNLTTICHLLGTPWELPFKDTILFVEDTCEPMYKIDRMLTQLAMGGHLHQLSGLLIGCFDCGTDSNENLRLQEDIWKRLLELTENSTFPIWGNLPIGHLDKNHALPIGLRTTQNSSSGAIEFDFL